MTLVDGRAQEEGQESYWAVSSWVAERMGWERVRVHGLRLEEGGDLA